MKKLIIAVLLLSAIVITSSSCRGTRVGCYDTWGKIGYNY